MFREKLIPTAINLQKTSQIKPLLVFFSLDADLNNKILEHNKNLKNKESLKLESSDQRKDMAGEIGNTLTSSLAEETKKIKETPDKDQRSQKVIELLENKTLMTASKPEEFLQLLEDLNKETESNNREKYFKKIFETIKTGTITAWHLNKESLKILLTYSIENKQTDNTDVIISAIKNTPARVSELLEITEELFANNPNNLKELLKKIGDIKSLVKESPNSFSKSAISTLIKLEVIKLPEDKDIILSLTLETKVSLMLDEDDELKTLKNRADLETLIFDSIVKTDYKALIDGSKNTEIEQIFEFCSESEKDLKNLNQAFTTYLTANPEKVNNLSTNILVTLITEDNKDNKTAEPATFTKKILENISVGNAKTLLAKLEKDESPELTKVTEKILLSLNEKLKEDFENTETPEQKLTKAGFTVKGNRIVFEMPANSKIERSFLKQSVVAEMAKYPGDYETPEQVQLLCYSTLLKIITKDGSINTNKHSLVGEKSFHNSNQSMALEVAKLQILIEQKLSQKDYAELTEDKRYEIDNNATISANKDLSKRSLNVGKNVKGGKGYEVDKDGIVKVIGSTSLEEIYELMLKTKWKTKNGIDNAPFDLDTFIKANPGEIKTGSILVMPFLSEPKAPETTSEATPEPITKRDILVNPDLSGIVEPTLKEKTITEALTLNRDAKIAQFQAIANKVGEKYSRNVLIDQITTKAPYIYRVRMSTSSTLAPNSITPYLIEFKEDSPTENPLIAIYAEKSEKPIYLKSSEWTTDKIFAKFDEISQKTTNEKKLDPAQVAEVKKILGEDYGLTIEGTDTDTLTIDQYVLLRNSSNQLEQSFTDPNTITAFDIYKTLQNISSDLQTHFGRTNAKFTFKPLKDCQETFIWTQGKFEDKNLLVTKILSAFKTTHTTEEYAKFNNSTETKSRENIIKNTNELNKQEYLKDLDKFTGKTYKIDGSVSKTIGETHSKEDNVNDEERNFARIWRGESAEGEFSNTGRINKALETPPFNMSPEKVAEFIAAVVTEWNNKEVTFDDFLKKSIYGHYQSGLKTSIPDKYLTDGKKTFLKQYDSIKNKTDDASKKMAKDMEKFMQTVIYVMEQLEKVTYDKGTNRNKKADRKTESVIKLSTEQSEQTTYITSKFNEYTNDKKPILVNGKVLKSAKGTNRDEEKGYQQIWNNIENKGVIVAALKAAPFNIPDNEMSKVVATLITEGDNDRVYLEDFFSNNVKATLKSHLTPGLKNLLDLGKDKFLTKYKQLKDSNSTIPEFQLMTNFLYGSFKVLEGISEMRIQSPDSSWKGIYAIKDGSNVEIQMQDFSNIFGTVDEKGEGVESITSRATARLAGANKEGLITMVEVENGVPCEYYGKLRESYDPNSVIEKILHTKYEPPVVEKITGTDGKRKEVINTQNLTALLNKFLQKGIMSTLAKDLASKNINKDEYEHRMKEVYDNLKLNPTSPRPFASLSKEACRYIQEGFLIDDAKTNLFNETEWMMNLDGNGKQKDPDQYKQMLALYGELIKDGASPHQAKKLITQIQSKLSIAVGAMMDSENHFRGAGVGASYKIDDNFTLSVGSGVGLDQKGKASPMAGLALTCTLASGNGWKITFTPAITLTGAYGTLGGSHDLGYNEKTGQSKVTLNWGVGGGVTYTGAPEVHAGLGFSWGKQEDAKSMMENAQEQLDTTGIPQQLQEFRDGDYATREALLEKTPALKKIKEDILAKYPQMFNSSEREKNSDVHQMILGYIDGLIRTGQKKFTWKGFINSIGVGFSLANLCQFDPNNNTGLMMGLGIKVNESMIFFTTRSEKSRYLRQIADINNQAKAETELNKLLTLFAKGQGPIDQMVTEKSGNTYYKPGEGMLGTVKSSIEGNLTSPLEGFQKKNDKLIESETALIPTGDKIEFNIEGTTALDTEVYIDPTIKDIGIILDKTSGDEGKLFIEGNMDDLIITRRRITYPRPLRANGPSIKDIITIRQSSSFNSNPPRTETWTENFSGSCITKKKGGKWRLQDGLNFGAKQKNILEFDNYAALKVDQLPEALAKNKALKDLLGKRPNLAERDQHATDYQKDWEYRDQNLSSENPKDLEKPEEAEYAKIQAIFQKIFNHLYNKKTATEFKKNVTDPKEIVKLIEENWDKFSPEKSLAEYQKTDKGILSQGLTFMINQYFTILYKDQTGVEVTDLDKTRQWEVPGTKMKMTLNPGEYIINKDHPITFNETSKENLEIYLTNTRKKIVIDKTTQNLFLLQYDEQGKEIWISSNVDAPVTDNVKEAVSKNPKELDKFDAKMRKINKEILRQIEKIRETWLLPAFKEKFQESSTTLGLKLPEYRTNQLAERFVWDIYRRLNFYLTKEPPVDFASLTVSQIPDGAYFLSGSRTEVGTHKAALVGGIFQNIDKAGNVVAGYGLFTATVKDYRLDSDDENERLIAKLMLGSASQLKKLEAKSGEQVNEDYENEVKSFLTGSLPTKLAVSNSLAFIMGSKNYKTIIDIYKAIRGNQNEELNTILKTDDAKTALENFTNLVINLREKQLDRKPLRIKSGEYGGNKDDGLIISIEVDTKTKSGAYSQCGNPSYYVSEDLSIKVYNKHVTIGKESMVSDETVMERGKATFNIGVGFGVGLTKQKKTPTTTPTNKDGKDAGDAKDPNDPDHPSTTNPGQGHGSPSNIGVNSNIVKDSHPQVSDITNTDTPTGEPIINNNGAGSGSPTH